MLNIAVVQAGLNPSMWHVMEEVATGTPKYLGCLPYEEAMEVAKALSSAAGISIRVRVICEFAPEKIRLFGPNDM